MKRIRTALQKTESSDVFFYTSDASEFLSFFSGCVQIQLTLPSDIVDGVYSRCDKNKLFPDYMLFSVNQKDRFFNYPGMYAALSNEGIVFSIWTGYGRFYIVDKVSNLTKNNSFVIEFGWDSSGNLLGSEATMAIMVNGTCVASGDFMIKSESSSNINFFALDSKNIDFNIDCLIHDFACYSELPPFLFDKVNTLTSVFLSGSEFVIGGKNGSLVFAEDMCRNGSRIETGHSPENLSQTVSVCDITGNIFFATSYNDGFPSGNVQKYEPGVASRTKEISGLEYPVCISVIQKDGIDFPRSVYYDDSECTGLWIGSKTKLIRVNADLIQEVEATSFVEINSIACLNDNSCWLSDKLGNVVFHVLYDGTVMETFSITSPTFICASINNDVFVYSSSGQKVFKITNGIMSNNGISVGHIVGMDCHKNKGYLVVCKSNGDVSSYNRDLSFRQTAHICDTPSAILVSRGYNQDDFYLVDGASGKVFRRKVSNINSDIATYDFDKDILFNGSFAATARTNGKPNFYGTFEMPFASGRSIVKNISVYPYKVDKRSVDLSAGGFVGAYLKDHEITSENNPTDVQGGVIEVSEISIGS